VTRRRAPKATLRKTRQRCTHCGYRGLVARYRKRRLIAEQCPDCGREWLYVVKPLPVRR